MCQGGTEDAQCDELVNIDAMLSKEGRARQMAGLRKLVTAFAGVPGIIGLHGGLPPASSFPIKGVTLTLEDGRKLEIDDPVKARILSCTRHANGLSQHSESNMCHGAFSCSSHRFISCRAAVRNAIRACKPAAQRRCSRGCCQYQSQCYAILCIRITFALHDRCVPLDGMRHPACFHLKFNSCISVQLAAAQQYCLNTSGYAPLHQWAKKHTWQMHAPPGDHDLIITPGNNQTIEVRPHWLSGPSHAGRMHPATLYYLLMRFACEWECVKREFLLQAQKCGNHHSVWKGHVTRVLRLLASCGSLLCCRPYHELDGVLSNMALQVIMRLLMDPGEAMLCEEYTYPHIAESMVQPQGYLAVPLAMDEHGILPCYFRTTLQSLRDGGKSLPKLLYTIPVGQNPTGGPSLALFKRLSCLIAAKSVAPLMICWTTLQMTRMH